MRTAGAVEELQVQVHDLAIAPQADRELAVHLVEVQRLLALTAGGAAGDRAIGLPQDACKYRRVKDDARSAALRCDPGSLAYDSRCPAARRSAAACSEFA